MSSGNRYLVVSLHQERYAIPLLKTKEVVQLGAVTPVPFTPRYFKGVMNLRGQVISIIDLRLKLQLPQVEPTMETAIVILDLFPICVGIIVDSADCVLPIAQSEISTLPASATTTRQDFITGVARREHELILLLDVDKIANIDELNGLQKGGVPRAA